MPAPRHLIPKNLVPNVLSFRSADARINDSPARAIFKQPEIDVVEGEGQWHAQPLNLVDDTQRLAVGRPGVEFVFDAHALNGRTGGAKNRAAMQLLR